MTAAPSLFRRIFDRIIPRAPDFFSLINEQAEGVLRAVNLLVQFMESATPGAGQQIMEQEHKSDDLKVRNLQILSDAFSTPIDREDIYRAIIGLDEIVNYCKTTVKEVDVLSVQPGKSELDMAMRLQEGTAALRDGYRKLPADPAGAALCCTTARKAERAVERAYRQALAELFQGTDYINMFKRREIYRHLSNTADRIAACADMLHDITVKMG